MSKPSMIIKKKKMVKAERQRDGYASKVGYNVQILNRSIFEIQTQTTNTNRVVSSRSIPWNDCDNLSL